MTPKILFLDIESSPLKSYTWGIHDQEVIKVISDWQLLSFAYKWGNAAKVSVHSRRTNSESGLVRRLWKLFDEADFIVAHNGDEFDIKKVRAKFIQQRLSPPSPSQGIDTLKISRKYFKFTSNKLDYVCKTLGIGEKAKTGGFELWEACMAGDKDAFKRMENYNKKDVVLLEKLYKKLRPWIYNQPGISIGNHFDACTSCNSRRIEKRGYRVTRTGRRSRLQCKDCGAWSQGKVVRGPVEAAA